jgi:hypothetical protein
MSNIGITWQPEGVDEETGERRQASVGRICRWGGYTIADVCDDVPKGERNDMARDIAVSLNSHDDLVDALRGVLEFQGDYGANEIEMAKVHAEAYRVLNGLGDEK